MLQYPPKILMAFGECISGNEKFSKWLLNNGFPELSALAYSIRGSEEAFSWLMKNGFQHFAALDSAIDNDPKSYLWLKANRQDFLIIFADACHMKKEAIGWLQEKDLHIFIHLAKKIKEFRDGQVFDYHKLHF